MAETLQLILICAPFVAFLTAMILYGVLFHWWRSFQGRSLMGVLGALNLVLGMNAALNIISVVAGDVQDWWVYPASVAFLILTISGISFCFSVVRSRQRPPKVSEVPGGEVTNERQERS